ncbi:hypothetical protein EVAR_27973_1 [Eumeta japonica]|uniref:Uncharacterized protein n=1 Tax=Eumeta variegata TaxID=151549 RepID=A0A4C1WEK2_EUMVA|nr:hypothetical protein EVAR_27973_1 [Eumeta japonica]
MATFIYQLFINALGVNAVGAGRGRSASGARARARPAPPSSPGGPRGAGLRSHSAAPRARAARAAAGRLSPHLHGINLTSGPAYIKSYFSSSRPESELAGASPRVRGAALGASFSIRITFASVFYIFLFVREVTQRSTAKRCKTEAPGELVRTLGRARKHLMMFRRCLERKNFNVYFLDVQNARRRARVKNSRNMFKNFVSRIPI